MAEKILDQIKKIHNEEISIRKISRKVLLLRTICIEDPKLV